MNVAKHRIVQYIIQNLKFKTVDPQHHRRWVFVPEARMTPVHAVQIGGLKHYEETKSSWISVKSAAKLQ